MVDNIFTKEYYDSIWETVHRHDYCDYVANKIIHDYGKNCSVLDVGTGCGFLVKMLRERGCDAWGTEISKYALENTCASGYVIKGDILDIPFKDDKFDVVFSQGVWEYVKEENVPRARDEIWRVGRNQFHQIDHNKCDWRPDFVTWKSQEWWDEQLAAPKVLVGCPTHESKEYAHEAWIKMVKNIDYPNFDIMVVDNSPTDACLERWRKEIPMLWLGHAEPSLDLRKMDMAQRLAASMEVIRKTFLQGKYAWWLNIEIDVIPDSSILKLLLRYGKDADWTAHTYPPRGETEECCSGIGCSLFSRRLIEDFSFKGAGDHVNQNVDGYFWNWVRPQKKYKVREFWGHLAIEHLRGPNG